MLVIPTQPFASQTLSVTLAGQACTINIYQLDDFGLFLDLYVNNALIVGGRICQNANRIVRAAYLGFIGDLAFFDQNAGPQQPATDPVYTGLGTQYVLMYLEVSDLGQAS